MKRIAHFLLFVVFLSSQLVAQWSNGQEAEFVIGQGDFISNTPSTTDATFALPYDVGIDFVNGKMYVADLVNHRVLRFRYPILGNRPQAELVFGQADFNSNLDNRGGAVAANSLGYPTAVAIRNGTLWICDMFNNRILKFENAANISTNGPNADGVLGQIDFVTGTAATSQARLNAPYDITFDESENLWVAEMQSNRAVRFNDANNKNNGANADAVLGQTDFTHSTPSTSQVGMRGPSGLVCDGTTLYLVDMLNSRVLRYNDVLNKANGSEADGVLGQADFDSGDENRGGNCAANTMQNPFKVEIGPEGALLVADQANNRILNFLDAVNQANGADADNVLGKLDMVTNAMSECSQSLMCFPNGMAYDNINDKLVCCDEENNRLLQFSAGSAVSVDDNFNVPAEFYLAQNYPNPFNPATVINYTVPKDSHVRLSVFNILGKDISLIVNEVKTAGEYNVNFDGTKLPTGVYFYQLIAGDVLITKKMILLK